MPISRRPFLAILTALIAVANAGTFLVLAGEPSIIAETELTFSANGHPLPVPLIRARLYDTEGLLMLDTGSSHHVISSAFADTHRVARLPAPEGRDHVGEKVSAELASPGDWQIGPVTRALHDAVVIPVPAAFTPLGIVGFLSPQNFFERGFVILDFHAGRMIVLGDCSSAALQSWLHGRYPAAESLSLPRAAGPDPRKLYVHARLGAQAPVVAEIDTGGSMTEIDDPLLPVSTPAAKPASSMTVNGNKNSTRTAEMQTVVLANHNFGPMRVKARAPQAGFSALIGMDLLRQTVLVIPLEPQDPLRLLIKSP